MDKTVILTKEQWTIVLQLLANQKRECEYINRKGYLTLEEIEESISHQINAIPCESV